LLVLFIQISHGVDIVHPKSIRKGLDQNSQKTQKEITNISTNIHIFY